MAFFLVALFGFGEQTRCHLSESGVGYEAHGVDDALGLAVVVKSGNREARVRPYLHLHFGPSPSQTRNDALQESDRGVARVGVARPQECTDQMTALAVEDEKRMVHVRPVIAVVVTTLLIPVGGGSSVASKSKSTLSGAPSLPRSLR